MVEWIWNDDDDDAKPRIQTFTQSLWESSSISPQFVMISQSVFSLISMMMEKMFQEMLRNVEMIASDCCCWRWNVIDEVVNDGDI